MDRVETGEKQSLENHCHSQLLKINIVTMHRKMKTENIRGTKRRPWRLKM